ncbi:hypothetical protein ACFVFQ_27540 [Streptomyces sp. NPDC057743]|uniref:hypothetical protein n=1 Tax=Streptomyces sp. NPDC057743 TaxID=3346236 RepID=UPI00367E9073
MPSRHHAGPTVTPRARPFGARHSPRHAARYQAVGQLRPGARLMHRAGDRFPSRKAFEHVHGADFDAAHFEETPMATRRSGSAPTRGSDQPALLRGRR